MLDFKFENIGGNNPHRMEIRHSKRGILASLNMTDKEAMGLFYKLTEYKANCEQVGGYRSPNQSKEVES